MPDVAMCDLCWPKAWSEAVEILRWRGELSGKRGRIRVCAQHQALLNGKAKPAKARSNGELITAIEAAKLLDCSRATIIKRAIDGVLPVAERGPRNSYWFRPQDVEALKSQ